MTQPAVLAPVFRGNDQILIDTVGRFVRVDPAAAQNLLAKGYRPPTESEVRAEEATQRGEKPEPSLLQSAASFGAGAARGAADVAQTAARAGAAVAESPIAGGAIPGGALIQQGVRAAGAATRAAGVDVTDVNRPLTTQALGVAGGAIEALRGGQYEAGRAETEQQAAEAERRAAETSPLAFEAGTVAGELTAGTALSGAFGAVGQGATALARGAGLGARAAGVLGTTLAGGAEGAFYGASTTERQAQLAGQTDGATGEQLLMGIGLGAVLAAGVSAGAEGLGALLAKPGAKLASAAESKVSRIVSEAEQKAEVASGQSILDRMAGVLQDAQHVLTGADLDALKKLGPTNTTGIARAQRLIVRNQDAIRREAANTLRADLTTAEEGVSWARRNWSNAELRSENFRPLIDNPKAARNAGLEFADSFGHQIDDTVSAIEQRFADVADKKSRQQIGGIVEAIKREREALRRAMSATEDSASAVDRIGLASKDVGYLREGMRNEAGHPGAFQGATREQVRAIARGEAPTMDSRELFGITHPQGKPFDPVRVEVYKYPDRAPEVILEDGRHRMVSARNAGADELLANVKTFEKQGREWVETGEVTRPVSLQPRKFDPTRDAADVMTSLNRVKQNLGKVHDHLAAQGGKLTTIGEQARREAFDAMKQHYETVRQALTDESVWGRAGQLQRDGNAAWEKQLRGETDYQKALLRSGDRDWDTGFRDFAIDEAKAAAFVDRIGKYDNDSLLSSVRSRLEGNEQLLTTMRDSLPSNAVDRAELTRQIEAVQRSRSHLDRIEHDSRLITEFDEKLAAPERNAAGLGQVLNPVTLGIAGTVALGPFGGLAGVGAGLALKPATTAMLADQLREVAERVVKRNLFTRARTAVKRSAKVMEPKRFRVPSRYATLPLAVSPAVAAFVGRHKSLEAAADKRRKQLQELQRDPGLLFDGVQAKTGDLPTAAPEIAASLAASAKRAVDLLTRTMPVAYGGAQLLAPGRKPVVARHEIMKWARTWAAVEDPRSVIDSLERGDVTLEQVRALEEVYPETYAQLQQSVLTEIIDADRLGHPIDLSRRGKLSIMLNLQGAGIPALSPDMAAKIDQYRKGAAEKQKAQRPPARRRAPHLSATAELPNQRWPSQQPRS